MSANFFRGLKFAIPLSLILWALLIWLATAIVQRASAAESVPATEWVYQGIAAVDMAQTLNIKNTPGIQESNPILGAYPSDAKVVGYFAVTGVVHYLITRELVTHDVPAPIVQLWECVGIGIEAAAVGHNYQLGIRVRF